MDLKAGTYLVPVTFHFRDQDGNPVWGRVSSAPPRPSPSPARRTSSRTTRLIGSVSKGDVTALVKPGAYSATCYGEGFGFYSYTRTTTTYSQIITGNTATDTDSDRDDPEDAQRPD